MGKGCPLWEVVPILEDPLSEVPLYAKLDVFYCVGFMPQFEFDSMQTAAVFLITPVCSMLTNFLVGPAVDKFVSTYIKGSITL